MPHDRKVLFSAVKNEAPFLLEWVAYHRAIGFDLIFVVSNDSDDGTTELLDALQAAGVVHHISHPVAQGESPQGKAAAAANDSGLLRDGDWVIWLDADEFLNIRAGGGKVADLVAAIGPGAGMLIPWRIFGDGGNAVFPGRFVSRNFTRAAERDFAGNKIVKTFFRHRDGATRLSSIANHRPHLLNRKTFRAQDFLNAGGVPVDAGFRPTKRWLQGIEGKANFSIPEADYRWDIAQINHYMLRTREMFDLKAHRGRGFLNIVQGKPIARPRHTPEFFAAQNRNEAEDATILRHQANTTREMNRLLALPGVRAAHETGLQLTATRIEAMQQQTDNIASATEAEAPPLSVPAITLPDAERALVERLYASHDVILEYGSGGSTLLAAAQPHSLVMSVESDRAWADNLRAVLARDMPDANVVVHWADIGPTGKWGRPVNQRAWGRFHLYPISVWDQDWFRHPDLILIDGRFRVGCLLTAMLRITRPVTVLFDDYKTRGHYVSAVETFVKPAEITGRMARFEIEPMAFPVQRLAEITRYLSLPD